MLACCNGGGGGDGMSSAWCKEEVGSCNDDGGSGGDGDGDGVVH